MVSLCLRDSGALLPDLNAPDTCSTGYDGGGQIMPMNEADPRAKLIDPAIYARGWTNDLVCREETAGAIEIIEGKPRKQSQGRVDYTLRVKVNPETQPVAVALIEAKAEHLSP